MLTINGLTPSTVFFSGRRLDAETNLMYYRARYYDADLGRFVGRDPLEYVDGLSLYEYVNNNPTRWLDPLGFGGQGSPIPDTPYNGVWEYNPATGSHLQKIRRRWRENVYLP